LKQRIDKATLWLPQILEGLSYVHKKNIIHNDMKPENILCTAEKCFLIDFGHAKTVEEIDEKLCGTADYWSPERIDYYKSIYVLQDQNAIKWSEKDDIWATGVSFYSLLTGQALLPHLFHPRRVVKRTREEMLTDFTKNIEALRKPGVDENLINLLKGMLEFDPAKRLSAEQALQHKFFEGSAAQQLEESKEDTTGSSKIDEEKTSEDVAVNHNIKTENSKKTISLRGSRSPGASGIFANSQNGQAAVALRRANTMCFRDMHPFVTRSEPHGLVEH
jgi:calcium/calmodulin-dependent protein kinase I